MKLNAKNRAKVFSIILWIGKISATIRYISEREKGEALLPEYCGEETGDEVSEVLKSKYTDGRDVKSDKIPVFYYYQDILDIEVSELHIE